MAVAINISKSKNTRDYTKRTVRPTPGTARRAFGAWMLSENWESVEKRTNPTEKVQELRRILNKQVEKHFPVKKYKDCSQDLPYKTDELKKLDRHKRNEHKKNGTSETFKEIKLKFDRKLKAEATRYIKKNVTEAKSTNPAKAHMTLKRLAEAPGDKN